AEGGDERDEEARADELEQQARAEDLGRRLAAVVDDDAGVVREVGEAAAELADAEGDGEDAHARGPQGARRDEARQEAEEVARREAREVRRAVEEHAGPGRLGLRLGEGGLVSREGLGHRPPPGRPRRASTGTPSRAPGRRSPAGPAPPRLIACPPARRAARRGRAAGRRRPPRRRRRAARGRGPGSAHWRAPRAAPARGPPRRGRTRRPWRGGRA